MRLPIISLVEQSHLPATNLDAAKRFELRPRVACCGRPRVLGT